MRTLPTGKTSSDKAVRGARCAVRSGTTDGLILLAATNAIERSEALLRPRTAHRAPRTGAKRPGFTLIELSVVLLALVIVAAAVVPALHGAGRQEDLAGVAARVAASARFARDEAIERQTAITLTVQPELPAVRLAVDGTAEAPLDASFGAPVSRSVAGPQTMGGQSPLSSLPSAFAFVRLPLRIHARLEAVPETLNGSAPVTPASGGELPSLRFPPDGRTVGGVVVLTDDRGRTLRVAVTPDTGRVRVESGNG
jgi:prepilin-type N-terminal cleavage/methylation domain-containing protein